jgi:glycosyltransferase involved in cell wall biosynthesis
MNNSISAEKLNYLTNDILVDQKITHLKPVISILIPAYNEERTLENVINRTQKVLEGLSDPYEIIVVDDGSTDHTWNIAYTKNVSVIRNYRNCGKGHALQTGFDHCKGNIIVTMDADGSHQPEQLLHLINPLFKNECDVVIGSRFQGSIEEGAIRKTNLVGNMIFNLLLFLLYRKLLTDTQSGFRAFRKSVLTGLSLTSARYEIESEMTAKLLKNRFQIKEVPVYCAKPERPSGLKAFEDGYRIFRIIVKTFLGRNNRGSQKRE